MGKIETDVVYDSAHNLGADLYYPNTETARGAVIDIHGGGWFRGDKAKDADWAARLAGEGFFVVVPNYRYAPADHYPAPLEDMATLYEWVTHSSYPFDHAHLAVVGSSAGGNMAVEMGIKYGIPVVSLSGILDIDSWLSEHADVVAAEGDTSGFNSSASSTINQDGANDAFYKWFVTNYFDDHQDEYAAGTPYHRVTDATGPMYLANSLNEFVPVSGVLTLTDTLVAHGIPVTSRFLTGTRHAKGYLEDVYDETLLFLNQFI